MNTTVIRTCDELAALPTGARDYYFNNTTSRDQWTLFIRFYISDSPLATDLRIRKASKALIDADLPHSCTVADNGLVTYTIYTGAIDTHLPFLKTLAQRLVCPALRVKVGELPLAHGLSARFDGQPCVVQGSADQQALFSNLTVRGIPKVSEKFLFDPAIGDKISLGERILLHTLIGHVFCATQYGEHYLGRDYHITQWDRGVFTRLGDVLTLKDITTYVAIALNSLLPRTINPMLQANPVTIDVASLVGLSQIDRVGQPALSAKQSAADSIPEKTIQPVSADAAPLLYHNVFTANYAHICATA